MLNTTPYMEVPFINGYTEFQEILSRTILVSRENVSDKIEIELHERALMPESITFYDKNESNVNFTVSSEKRGDVWFLIIEGNKPNINISLSVSYSFKNEEPKRMYSVDYSTGIIYFSEPIERQIKISYQSDRVILTGKKAKQLEETEYSYIDGRVNIHNFKENSNISFLYTKNKTLKRNISPILQDLKLNYITMDERSL